MRHRLAALIAATVPLACTATPALGATTTEDEVVRSSGYEFRYFGRDLGDESFSIYRTQTGYRIEAQLELGVGDQAPSRSTYFLDHDRRLVSATYEELVADGARAEYRVEGDELLATLVSDPDAEPVRITLEPDAIVTGPHYVTDFFVLHPLDLEVGDEHEQPAYTFGFEGWEPVRVTLRSKRERDQRVRDFHGNRHDTRVIRCWIVTEDKTYRTRSRLDADGVSVRISVDAPIGSMTAILE